MNYIYLDFDAADKKQEAIQFAADMEKSDLLDLSEENKTGGFIEAGHMEPGRGILITRFNSGWLNYHSKLLRENPMITHWIVAVLWNGKQAVKDMIYRQLSSAVEEEDYYCEIIFEDSDSWDAIREAVKRSVKTKKSCAVVSKNRTLAQDAAEVMQTYLKDWVVHPIDDVKNNDYSYEDAVLVVGNSCDEMLLLPPQKGARKKVFWLNEPFFLENEAKASIVNEIGERMNESGWNIFDYQSITYMSSIEFEMALVKIYREEITPMALMLEDDFVMWDDYGLPVPFSGMSNENIQLFLESNCRFSHIACQLSAKRKNNER